MEGALHPGNPEGESGGGLSGVNRRAVEFLISLNAALINIRMYPSTSEMIASSVESAYRRLEAILESGEELTLGEAENLLLVNGERLPEKDQARPPVLSFLENLRRRDIYSITFAPGIGASEFRSFLEALSMDPEELKRAGGLEAEISRRGCAHLLVNEKRFIPVSDEETVTQREEPVVSEEARLREEELKRLAEKLKDERFISYLTGKTEKERVSGEVIGDILANPPRFGMLLRQVVRETVVEHEDPVESLAVIRTALERAATLLLELEDQDLRDMDAEEVGRAVAFLEPSELKEYLLGEESDLLKELRVRTHVFQCMRENKVLDLLESVIREHEALERLVEEDAEGLTEAERERFEKLSALIDEIYTFSVGKPWEGKVSDRIFQADMWKKIVEGKERSGSAGASTLVYQISSLLVSEGLALDVDELARDLSISENIPRLLRKLYRARRPETVLRLIEGLLDNLDDMSPEIRLRTAETLKNIPDALELSRRLSEFPVAHEMKDRLLQRLEKERELNEIYESVAACLVGLAQAFVLAQEFDPAAEIIDTFWKHHGADSGRKPEQRRIALEAIATVASEPVLDFLAEVLREGDVQTIQQVAELLIRFEERSIQPLIKVLKDSDDLLVRRVTFEALENIGKEAILALINDLEKHNPWHMYRNIISILAEIGNRSIIQSLSRFLRHQNPEVRRETVRALAKIKSPETVNLLVEALEDRDEMVQKEACLGLGAMRDVSTVPNLIEVVRPPRSFRREKRRTAAVRCAALWALGEIGDRSAIPYCRHFLDRRFWTPLFGKKRVEIKVAAAKALGSIGGEESLRILKAHARDRHPEVRFAISQSLRKISAGAAALTG
ncbi:MAG: HEAT repeat domain-containing protein [Candidatus Geothermincolales bacterium]